MNNLVINAERMWADLMESAAIGGTAKGGIRRLTLTQDDRRVRDWLREQCESIGCKVEVDEIGNIFATMRGRRSDLPPIAMGSHLDTQPTGGKFDGILGVLAGLECLRTLSESGYRTNAPIMLVNWTNEEGSRFAPAMLGSGVHAGVFDRNFADSREDAEHITFGDAIEAIGYRGPLKAGSTPIGAMFELHIEQGPILEAEGDTIGVVRGVQGMRWYDIAIVGRESHAGSTPMHMRRDALTISAEFILAVDRIARETFETVATVGTITANPNSRNVIPGRVELTVDLRHPRTDTLDFIECRLQEVLTEITRERRATATMVRVWDSPPVSFAEDCLESIRQAAGRCGYRTRDMISGAGHDAAYIARIAPTAMIFVPCAGGLSHNEQEDASFEDCKAGAQVLLQSVIAYDRRWAG